MVAVCCKTTHPVATAKSSATSSLTPTPYSPAESYLTPVPSDLGIAQKYWPATTLDNLQQGYSIYEDKCTDCHEMKMPQDFTLEAWTAIMHKMARKAKLDSNQYQLVFQYTLTRREAILSSGK